MDRTLSDAEIMMVSGGCCYVPQPRCEPPRHCEPEPRCEPSPCGHGRGYGFD
jgi:hypothetical protein